MFGTRKRSCETQHHDGCTGLFHGSRVESAGVKMRGIYVPGSCHKKQVHVAGVNDDRRTKTFVLLVIIIIIVVVAISWQLILSDRACCFSVHNLSSPLQQV
jgi:hypothetical protein